MIQTIEIALVPQEANDRSCQLRKILEVMGVERIDDFRIVKRSIDARQKPIVMRMKVEVAIGEESPSSWNELPIPQYAPISSKKKVIIVGAGPSGMFAALKLIEDGIKPIILERGKDVRSRRRDLKAIQEGVVNPDSNYCFGEGGAGTYSDGKLYTRSSKRGDISAILKTFVAHGASPDILIDAHPHIGSNKLPEVVTAMRESILKAGGEVYFEHRVTDFILKDGEMKGVIAQGKEFLGDAVILATGHSARDIFELLQKKEILIEAKPFAVGVRIEHPQPLIDRIQYRQKADTRDPYLPAASYSLVTNIQNRGVFSFCMCPGGFIVPSATAPDEVVVNGMSLSRRDSPFANSGMVVSVELEDLQVKKFGVLAGMMFQKEMEVIAAEEGQGKQKAPAQRLMDFLKNKNSTVLPSSSYHPGLSTAALHECLPPMISKRLQEGLKHFGKIMKGYLSEESVLIGVETRTSSPVRIPRDLTTLQHKTIKGLYPSGEGAGYAGGIVSAAMDGVRVAEKIIAKL